MKLTKDAFDRLVREVAAWRAASSAAELELVVRGAEIDGASFGRVVSYFARASSSTSPQTSPQTSLDVLLDDDIRCTISGSDAIKRFMKRKMTEEDAKKYVFIQKKRLSSPIDFEDYDLRVNLKSETPVLDQDMLRESMVLLRGFKWTMGRLKTRYSYSVHGDLFRLDCTTVRTLRGAQFQSASLAEAPLPLSSTYEVELEVLHTRSSQLDDRALALKMLAASADVLRLLQDSRVLLSRSDRAKLLAAYAELAGTEAFMGPKPVTLTFSNLRLPGPGVISVFEDYTATPKADGERQLLFIDGGGDAYFVDMTMAMRHAGFRHRRRRGCILDGEWLPQQAAYACFDAYAVDGRDVRGLPLASADDKVDTRLKALRSVVEGPSDAMVPLSESAPMPSLSVKEFVLIDSIDAFKKACAGYGKRAAAGAYPYDVDGLIFTPMSAAVGGAPGGTWAMALKWKPPENNTVDFVVRPRWEDAELTPAGKISVRVDLYAVNDGRVPVTASDALAERVPKKLQWIRKSRGGLVFFDRTYVEQSQDASGKLQQQLACENGEAIEDGAVIECRFDTTARRWRPTRVRHDKMRGRAADAESWYGTANAYATAKNVYHTIKNPVTLRQLASVEPFDAFDVAEAGEAYYDDDGEKDESSRAMRLFHNAWVKNRNVLQPMRSLRPVSLLDVACGRGGDINKWVELGVERVLGVDVMEDGLAEAIRRASTASNAPDALFLRMDASKPFEDAGQFEGMQEDDAAVARVAFGLSEPLHDDSLLSRRLLTWQKTVAAGFDVATCMFALHYFCRDQTSLSNLIDNVRKHLKVGGLFAGVCLDGRVVDDRLRGIPRGQGVGSVSASSSGRDSYAWHITKLYERFESLGSAIRVYNGNIGRAQDEYLVDFEHVVSEFSRKGLNLISKKQARKLGLKDATGTFDLLYDELGKADRSLNRTLAEAYAMTEGEKEYSFMNRWFVFEHVGSAV